MGFFVTFFVSSSHWSWWRMRIRVLRTSWFSIRRSSLATTNRIHIPILVLLAREFQEIVFSSWPKMLVWNWMFSILGCAQSFLIDFNFVVSVIRSDIMTVSMSGRHLRLIIFVSHLLTWSNFRPSSAASVTFHKNLKLIVLELWELFRSFRNFNNDSSDRFDLVQRNDCQRARQVRSIWKPISKVEEVSLCYLAPSWHVLMSDARLVLHQFAFKDDIVFIKLIESSAKLHRNFCNISR